MTHSCSYSLTRSHTLTVGCFFKAQGCITTIRPHWLSSVATLHSAISSNLNDRPRQPGVRLARGRQRTSPGHSCARELWQADCPGPSFLSDGLFAQQHSLLSLAPLLGFSVCLQLLILSSQRKVSRAW